MSKVLYYVEQGSCYLEIVKIRYQNDEYVKAIVNWYSRPSKTYLFTEKDLKIPKAAMKHWQKQL